VRTTYSLRCEKLGQSMARGHLPKFSKNLRRRRLRSVSWDSARPGHVPVKSILSTLLSDGSTVWRPKTPGLASAAVASCSEHPHYLLFSLPPRLGFFRRINRTLSCEIRPSRGCASSIEISPVLNGMGPLELVYCMMYLNAHTLSQKTQPGRN
jgi:hypothetical protein